MFFCNLKVDKNNFLKILFTIIFIIIFTIFIISIYFIFFKSNSSTKNQINNSYSQKLEKNDVFEITPENYSTILNTVTNNLDKYVGCKIHFSGYVYRLIDFKEDEFVLARDMIVKENPLQTLVIGFLCSSLDAKDIETGKWVDVKGVITKGNYYGEIAKIKVLEISECDEPMDKYVGMPDKTYIPTENIL